MVLLAMVSACNNSGQEAKDAQEEAQEVLDSAQEEIQSLSEEARNIIRQESEAFVQDIGKAQQTISQRILKLKAEMAQTSGETREKLEVERKELEEKQNKDA